MVIHDDAFALHITWTTYGSRLPGDERGYVSNTYLPSEGYQPKQNAPSAPARPTIPIRGSGPGRARSGRPCI